MAVLLRFIPSRAKWLQYKHLAGSCDFDVRALRDLFPRDKREERVSVFLADSRDVAEQFAVLWATSQERIENEDYVLIEDNIAAKYELCYEKCSGTTGVKLLDENHFELVPRGGLCIAQVISEVIWTTNDIYRLNRAKIVALVGGRGR
jgi:hypothetical protein